MTSRERNIAVALKLSDLRSLHMRTLTGPQEITVDAQRREGSAALWCDTGIACDRAERLVITGEGQVDLWPQSPGQYLAGPKGYGVAGKEGQFMAGALIGKVGPNGKAFFIGERHSGIVNEKGNLFLQIVPSPWNNTSSGQYRVRVQTKNESLP